MKFIAISDTHGQHHSLTNLPQADCIIHAGDISKRGTKTQVLDFLQWFSKLPYTHKVMIAGNHDFYFEEYNETIQEIIPDNIIYLNDSGIELEGIKIWGSPVQPWFHNWAFNRQRGEELAKYWELIPADTDILITHGPPYGILDKTVRDELVGCEDLTKRVQIIKPAYHIFGHIHEAYGKLEQNDTTYLNASVLNFHYRLVNPPFEFEMNRL